MAAHVEDVSALSDDGALSQPPVASPVKAKAKAKGKAKAGLKRPAARSGSSKADGPAAVEERDDDEDEPLVKRRPAARVVEPRGKPAGVAKKKAWKYQYHQSGKWGVKNWEKKEFCVARPLDTR